MQAFRLNRFRVTSRVYGGFGCLIVLGLAIAANGLAQLARVEDDANRLAVSNERMGNNFNSMLDLQTMRRAAMEYKALNDKTVSGQFNDAYEKSSALLKTAQRGTRRPRSVGAPIPQCYRRSVRSNRGSIGLSRLSTRSIHPLAHR
jgi:hypothetical protein